MMKTEKTGQGIVWTATEFQTFWHEWFATRNKGETST